MLRNIILFISFIGPIIGAYTAPMNNSTEKVIVRYGNIIADTATVQTVYDTSILLLVFGACVEANPIYNPAYTCPTRTVGPLAGKGGSVGSWVDSVPFIRLYKGAPPKYILRSTDYVWNLKGDTSIVVSDYSPNIIFTIRKPDVLEFAIDSNHAVFRVLKEDEEVFVVARYNNQLDSFRLFTVKWPSCMPWPECYYNPWWKK